MGGILSSFSEESVHEYMATPDDTWSEVELDDLRVPKTFRIKNVNNSLMNCTEGSTSGRVAQGLVSYACSSRGVECEISSSEELCVNLALNEIVESFHDDSIVCMKVPKSEKKIMQCISSGYPVCVVVPVTNEILEKKVEKPDDSNVFAMMPVILWGYSLINKKFAALVPLSIYEEPVVISFDHVVHEDSCDLYVVDVNENEGEEEEEEQEEEEEDEANIESTDKTDKTNKTNKTDKTDKANKTNKTEKTEKTDSLFL